MKKLLLLVAMQAEAEPTISEYKLQEAEAIEGFPFRIYRGVAEDQEMILMTSGLDSRRGVDNVGTQPAAVMAAIGIREFKPDQVLNIGTGGAFKESGAVIGKVYLIQDFKYHDRRIPIPGFKEYGQGSYPSEIPQELRENFELAIASTGNSLDITEEEKTRLKEMSKDVPVVKDMESAAIAQICEWTKTPLLAIKSVTDLIDGERITQEEFLENLQHASQKLHEGLRTLLIELKNIESAKELRSELDLKTESNIH